MLLSAAAVLATWASAAQQPASATAPTAPASSGRVHHSLKVTLDADRGWLSVEDEMRVPADSSGQGARGSLGVTNIEFLLHAGLKVSASEPVVEEVRLGDTTRFFGINSSTAAAPLKRYRVASADRGGTVRLRYEGKFDFGLSDQKEEYTRGFRETVGIVSKEGVYLSGNGFWYPHVDRGLVEYEMEVQPPEAWHVVSAGNGTSRDASGAARWESHGAVDEITLVGGPLVVYRDAAGPVEALVYLRQKDDALASKYLQATAQYVEMYRGLIGPYPYGKFALVENFWETGYGMPTFTLLGPQIIRFPFIINSSYPHEILHNWWGNSVFVDYDSGNWCEGLTAYLADHLIQEQRGRGDEYRRSTLQKYRDYVKAGRDFPLAEFRSRFSAATEAVGYGKTLMGFHTLRRRLGDETFARLLARFYRENRGRRASFRDLQKTAEAVAGGPLASFFDPWVTRAGAPALEVRIASVQPAAGGFAVEGTLKQTQGGEPFPVDVPVVVQTARGVVSETVRLEGAQAAFTIRTADPPVSLQVDPQFDVFRRLDPRETPPSIGQIFGEPRILAVLPKDATAEEADSYRKLVEGWRSETHAPEIKTDAEVASLPADRSVWLLGRRNRLASQVFPSGGALHLSATEMTVDGEKMALAGHSAVLVARHPASVEKAVGWIFADPPAAFPGLGRKLPHYGKYSYLGFEGDEPTNVVKGQWQESDSPLRVDLRAEGQRTAAFPALALPPRRALAELPPVFSQKALLGHVSALASADFDGRGLGTKGLDKAARYVADAFKAMGLVPGGDGGTFFQRFRVESGPNGTPVEAANVIAYIPGTKPEWKDQSALLTAHYDHLGRGWPDVHKGDEGKVHPGADDNASGVAVMLELARALAGGEKPKRSIVFIAFAAEEAKLAGSRHYVEHPLPFPVERMIGVVNLDTVGRLSDQKLSVLGTGTASEWQHIFRGASFVTGVESRNIPESIQSSDQTSFIARGVPAVQIFTAAHGDYHRPGDTADKIDGAGLVKVAAFVKEAVVYLGERPEPLTNTIPKPAPAASTAGSAPAPAPGGPARRVSFGTVPDFAFSGPGVRVEGTVAGSPAEKAGLRPGDVILSIDARPIASLQAFSDVLKALTPGQTVSVTLKRGDQELAVPVTVVER
jgi:hypothetical protein